MCRRTPGGAAAPGAPEGAAPPRVGPWAPTVRAGGAPSSPPMNRATFGAKRNAISDTQQHAAQHNAPPASARPARDRIDDRRGHPQRHGSSTRSSPPAAASRLNSRDADYSRSIRSQVAHMATAPPAAGYSGLVARPGHLSTAAPSRSPCSAHLWGTGKRRHRMRLTAPGSRKQSRHSQDTYTHGCFGAAPRLALL